MTLSTFARPRKNETTPDPGMYNIPSSFGRAPKFTFQSKRQEVKRDYDADYISLPSTLSKKGATIGERHRSHSSAATPGPGPCYSRPSTIGEGRKSNISERHDPKPPSTPGPGAYDVSYCSHGPSFSFGTGNRYSFLGHNDPDVAPGRYNLPSTLDLSRPMTIGRHPKEPFRKRAHPGPQYDTSKPLGKDKPAYSFPKAPRDQPVHSMPGPADYQRLQPIGNPSKIPPKMKGRTALRNPDTNKAPYYDIKSTFVPKKKSIGIRQETSYLTDSPGPVYNLPNPIDNMNKVHIRQRTEYKDPRNDVPSPDSYWITPITPVPPPFTGLSGPSDRTIINEKEEKKKPGPADYNVKTNTIQNESEKKGFKFNKGKYGEIKPDNSAPYYYSSSTLGGPMYTIGLRDD